MKEDLDFIQFKNNKPEQELLDLQGDASASLQTGEGDGLSVRRRLRGVGRCACGVDVHA